MNIGMMAAWNTDSGVAVHAEPLGKAWVEMGHELTVFSFIKDDFHGNGFTGEDEDYVIRCLGTKKTNFLDPRPILTRHFDVFVIQDLLMLPTESLAAIFPILKKRSLVFHVVHENIIPEDVQFYQFDWDGVIYFCDRQDFLQDVYPNARLIPFPCFPRRRKNKQEARKNLGLPPDKKIIYLFCQRGYQPFCRDLPEELKEDTVLLVIIPSGEEFLEEKNPPPWMIVRREKPLSHERFDDYLFAADAVIMHKYRSRNHAVVSSTVYQALGAGCPILVPGDSDFFYPFDQEVIRYQDAEDLRNILVKIIAGDGKYLNTMMEVDKFVNENSPERIAEEHLQYFEDIKKGNSNVNRS